MKIVKKKSTKSIRVKVRNDLAAAHNPLGILDGKVFWLLVSQIEQADEPRTHYRLPWECFKLIGGSQLNTKRKIESVLEILRSKSIIFRKPGVSAIFGYIAEARVVSGQYVDIQVSESMREYVSYWADEFYTHGKLSCFLSMPTQYSSRLYLALARYRGMTKTISVPIEDLKNILDITDKKGYVYFGNIKQKILDPAKKHFDKYADLSFEYETVKKDGRRVSTILFTVREKKQYQRTIVNELFDIIERYNSTMKSPPIEMARTGGVFKQDEKIKHYRYKDAICWFEGNRFNCDNYSLDMSADDAKKLIESGEITKIIDD